MKTFLTAIATLILAAASTMPLGAQLRVTVEETRDRSVVGETIVFDAEGVGQRVTKRLFVTFDPGRGNDVTLRDVRITPQGGEFSQELTDIDRLPVTIRNELRLEMFVSYLPRTPGPAQGVMQVVVELEGTGSQPSQAVYTVNLVGRVPAYSLSFMLPGSQARDLPVAGVLDFGNRSSGQATEATLVLRNTGSAAGTVWSAAVSGSSAYSLSNPPAFPAQLEPGSSLAVQLAFLPPGTDVYRGDLTFDFGLLEQQYGLSGIGGDLLRYRLISYSSDDIARSVTDIPAGSDIVFGDGIASVGVVGLNTRRNAQVVRSISVTGPFALTEGPALPDTLGPQESFTARVEPRPTGVGDLEGSIVIGDVSFPLFFSVPDLSQVRFSREGGALSASERVALGLSVAAPYVTDVSGTLELAFLAEDFDGDPAVQWATGGRQVAFTIPAGSTEADFGPSGEAVEFRSGSLSGEIVVTARLAADEWRVNLTPDPQPEVRFAVDVPDAPEVRFSRSGATVRGAEEVSLGLSIERPYPVEVTGALALDFVAEDFDGDPTVQWATGGRQVAFSIPAGETVASFGAEGAEVAFRAARVPGEMVVTASLRAEEWRLDLTPDAAPEVRFAVEVPDAPEVRFSREGGALSASERVALGLSVAAPFVTDISGTLELAFLAEDFDGDPAVQWATGGRQVAFTIPAGSTEADFGPSGEAVEFRSGSLSGEIVVTARLASDEWRVDLTPDPQPEVRFTVDVPDTPEVRFSREGGTLSASERVALGLSVAAPFVTDISGTLELAFLAEDLDGDPAVQWATGGRQVAFTIPAGSTEADFGPSGEAVEFRSGSLSGEIVVTARLASDEWRVDLTPDPQPEVRFTVDVPDAPEVRFSREGGALSASERVALGLSVAAPFVTDISGTLELAFLAEDFDGDPAVQWATGGRQVAFTIPAGSTEADFGPSGEAVEFRSGSLSGEIVVTARLASDEWRVDLTPNPQPEVRFAVDVPDAPEVRFSRSGATVRGAEEVSLGLSIERPYPVEVTGALALDFVAEDFDGDPTVQWATGGRQAAFSIPAGETAASFGAEGAEVAFRAARVPGEMVVTASLRAEEWRLDLTPDAAPEVRFAVEVPELPDVSFSLDGGTVGAAEQVALGVNLDRTYSTDIVGLLTLSFETQAFTSDPSVQWATGGRQVAFSIPRGGTAAIFRDLTTENAFQTGTVAGEIVVTARFVSVVEGIPLTIEQAQAQRGSLEITPDERPEVRFRVTETAPVLRRLALGSTGQGRFTLQVTGFATSREVDSLSFAFSGVSGSSLSTPSLEADVAEAFRTYYGGNQSASFGSQFTATVEFSLDEGVFEDLASVSATAGNGAGSSNSVALNLN